MPIFSAGSASVSIVPDFSGAQKAIGEFFARQSDISVKVKPDLSNVDVARTEAELNAMHGTAKVEIDKNVLSSSISSALEQALAFSGLERLGSLLTDIIKPTAITAVVGAFTELAASASQAVGVVALIPAALFAVAVPAGVVALGVQGMGAAFKALDTGNAQKIAEAMSKLAPAAQDFVLQVHALAPAWTALRLDVQQTLLTGVGTAVTNLARVALPILHTGLVETAAAMNSGLLVAMTALQGQGTAFATVFSNVAAMIRVANGAIAPLIQAFMTLSAVGSQFLPGLAQGFVNVATAFNNWIQHIAATGQLVTIIQNAITVLDQLGRLAGNVLSIITGVFAAAIPYGNLLLGLLVQLTGSLAAFVHSADGQTALQGFFSGISTALTILEPAINALVISVVQSLLPIVGQLVAALAPVAATLLQQIAFGFNQIAAILPPVAQVMAALVSAMAPLIPILVQIIVTLLPPLVVLAGQLTPIIAQLSQIIGQALLAVLNAVAPVLPIIGNGFVAILNALLPLIPPLLQIATSLLPPLLAVVVALVPSLVSFVNALVPVLNIIISIVSATVLPVLVTLLNNFAAGLNVLGPILGPLAVIILGIVAAVKVWTIAQALLDIALDANPIGLLTIAITALGIALVALVGFIATHTQEIAGIWLVTWTAMKDAFTATWNAIQSTAITVWNSISGFFTGAWATLSALWATVWLNVSTTFQTAWNGISAFAQSIWNAISAFAQAVWNGLAAFFSAAWASYSAGWSSFWNSVLAFFQSIWTTLSGWAEATWNTLASFFSAAWASYSAGWTNLWNSVLAVFQNVWSTLSSWAEATWNTLQAFWSTAWAAFSSLWTNLWNSVFSVFQSIWNSLLSFAQNIWNALQSFLTNGLNAFSAFWTGAWGSISAFFSTIWGAIQNTAISGWNAISSFLTGAINGFSGFWIGVWNTISGAVVAVWNGMVSGIQAAWNGLIGVVETPVRFVVNTVINGFINGVDDVLNFLGLGRPIHTVGLPFAEGGLMPADFATIVAPNTLRIIGDHPVADEAFIPLNNSPRSTAILGAAAARMGYSVQPMALGGLLGEIGGLVTNPGGTLANFVKSLFGDKGGSVNSPLTDLAFAVPVEMAKDMTGWLGDKVKSALTSVLTAGGSVASSILGALGSAASALLGALGLGGGGGGTAAIPPVASSGGANQAIVNAVAAGHGWASGPEWSALVAVINRESGFNNNAQNPTSTAYGMFQFLDSTWATVGGSKTSDPNLQAIYGLNYIARAYGDPIAAWNHEVAFGWYDGGGPLPPGWSATYNGTGDFEYVLNQAQMQAVANSVTGGGRDASPVWHFYLGDREITDLIDAHVTYQQGISSRTLRSYR